MISGKSIVVVLPAYNAEETLKRTYQEIPLDIVDETILVDDCSDDQTFNAAKKLGITHVIKHERNQGYGANQKTCFDKALSLNFDIVIVLHPDYQYTPKLIPSMCQLITRDVTDVVLASRILGGEARKGGMPLYKYIANRVLTYIQNWMIRQRLSEYHTGYRAYSRRVLQNINYKENSDNFVFDNQILSQIFMSGYKIREVSCPTLYADDSSSISFLRSIKYGLGVLTTSLMHVLHTKKIIHFRIYDNPTKNSSD
jgi:glycosyltransferase involved in cell wall biosynthesis